MSDETTPQDSAAMSPASDGSVAGKPVAWAALRDDGDIAWIGYTPDCAADGACCRRIVPLYRSPSLTAAEREAVETCIADDEAMTHHSRAAILRGLLERHR